MMAMPSIDAFIAAACCANEPAAPLRSVVSRGAKGEALTVFPFHDRADRQRHVDRSAALFQVDHLVLCNVFTARDFLKQQRGFLSAAMIEEHRYRRAESFFRGVAVNTTCAAVPTHDHAFSGYADDGVARNVDD